VVNGLRSAQLVVLLVVLFTAGTPAQEDPPPDESASSDPAAQQEPLDLGVIEEIEVSLMYLDVEVRDKKGRPISGLTREDFELQLNARVWPIYSVDDLCACDDAHLANVRPDGARGRASAPSGSPKPESASADSRPDGSAGPPPQAAGMAPPPAAGAVPPQVRQVIFYLDFSQLQISGRTQALTSAGQWIRDSMMPGDRVMIMAHAVRRGLHELCPFTSDPEELLATLDAAEDDPELTDSFPTLFNARIEECEDCMRRCLRRNLCPGLPCEWCCVECMANAIQEYRHGRRALTAIKMFMEHLQGIPGPKHVFLFHQNGVLFPGRFYPISNADFEVGEHIKLLEEVGTEAVEARAVVHAVQTNLTVAPGGLADEAANLGANLADYTGGTHNRGVSDLADVMGRAVGACRCTYRIAFEPPGEGGRRIYRATVRVRGKPLPFRYRVRQVTAEERLARRSRGVLGHPSLARDLGVSASLVPISSTGGVWSAAVQVALDIDRLRLLPLADGEMGALDVGALLYQEDGGKSWEMLIGAKVRKAAGQETNQFILHERLFHDLKPGRYRLVAFARNREQDLFGGAEANLALPDARKGGLAGPIVLYAERKFFPSALPLFEEEVPVGVAIQELSTGGVPVMDNVVRPGDLLDVVSWICPVAPSGAETTERPMDAALIRYLARDGKPVFRLPEPTVESAGSCFRVADRVITESLKPGSYTYHLSWLETEGGEPREATAEFRILEPPDGQVRAAGGP